MWLLNTESLSLEFHVVPPARYAILSHTWGEEEVLFQEAEKLFQEGLLAAAGAKYAESAARMPLRTQLGGQARLQHAICLDSLGQGQAAHSIYRSLSRHPTSFVAKRANQARFSIQALPL